MRLARSGGRWRKLRGVVLDEETHCGICGGEVDKGTPGTAKWGPVVDHILPLATHPHLAYTRSNVQLAHRHCNGRKGSRTLGTPTKRQRRKNERRPAQQATSVQARQGQTSEDW